MKRIRIKMLLFLALAIMGPMVAGASSLSFNPQTVATSPGKVFTLVLSVNPEGQKNYTAKVELKYPADLLEAALFTPGAGWMPLTQSGYDLIDNQNGVIIKTAGYPGGLSDPKIFGSVLFRVKKEGSGLISSGAQTMILDSSNKNVFSGSDRVSILAQSLAAPVQPAAPAPKKTPVSSKSSSSEPSTPLLTEQTQSAPEELAGDGGRPEQLAAAGEAVNKGYSNKTVMSLVIGLIALAVLVFAIYIFRRSSGKKS